MICKTLCHPHCEAKCSHGLVLGRAEEMDEALKFRHFVEIILRDRSLPHWRYILFFFWLVLHPLRDFDSEAPRVTMFYDFAPPGQRFVRTSMMNASVEPFLHEPQKF